MISSRPRLRSASGWAIPVAACLLGAALLCPSRACGPFFPNTILDDADDELLKMNQIAEHWSTLLKKRLRDEQLAGADTTELQDVTREILHGYMPRTRRMLPGKWTRKGDEPNTLGRILAYLDPRHEHRGQRGRQVPTHASHQYQREGGLTGFSEGTYALQRASTDEGIGNVLNPMGDYSKKPKAYWDGLEAKWKDKAIVGSRHSLGSWDKEVSREVVDVVDARYGRKSVYADPRRQEYISKNGIFGDSGYYVTEKDATGQVNRVLKNEVLSDNQMKEIAAWLSNLDPRHAQHKVPAFEINPVKAMLHRMEASAQVEGAIDGAFGFLKENLTEQGDSLEDIFVRSKGISRQNAMERAAREILGWDEARLKGFEQAHGAKYMERLSDELRHLRVPKAVGDDVSRTMRMFATNEAASEIGEFFDWFTRKWKAGVTVIWPSFHIRNVLSAVARNWQAGVFSPTATMHALDLVRGKTIQGAARKYGHLKGLSRNMTDKEATEALRNLIFKHKVHTHHVGMGQEYMRELDSASEFIGPANTSGYSFDRFAAPRDPMRGKWSLQNLNPIGEGSFVQRTGGGASYVSEGVVRVGPFLKMLEDGWDPQAAKKMVDALQVDYSALSGFEKSAMRRLFPFYAFHRGVVPWTLKQIAERPGGRVAQTAKGAARLRSSEEVMPESIQQSVAIPIAGAEEGSQRYLTSAGLMEEPVYGTLAPLLRLPVAPMEASGQFLRELASQSHPVAKGAYEFMSGRSSYFSGGEPGGRPLQSMTPHIGQVVENVRRIAGYPEQRPMPLGLREGDIPRTAEYIAQATPLVSGVLGKARQFTAPNRTWTERISGMSGVGRYKDVSARQQMAIRKELLDEAMLGIGGSEFSSVSVPEETLNALPEDQRQEGERYNTIRSMMIKQLRRQKTEEALQKAREKYQKRLEQGA